jgi:hypothetical protein
MTQTVFRSLYHVVTKTLLDDFVNLHGCVLVNKNTSHKNKKYDNYVTK